MRRRDWTSLAVVLASASALVAACSSANDEGLVAGDPSVWGDPGGTTSGTGSGTTGSGYGSTSSSASSGSVGSGGSWGGAGGGFEGPPDPPPEGQADAGSDAPFACDGLDPAQPVTLYLSADDSNSMGSPVLARELLALGVAPTAIRTYEFLNYYRISYAPPPAPALSLVPELELAAPGEYAMQIGVRSFDAIMPRRAKTITLVLDTSGSMSGEGIARERAAIKAIANSLAAGDIVNAVRWSTSNTVLMSGHSVTGPNDPAIVSMANALDSDGGTDLSAGLSAGYDLAKQHYGSSRLNRVVLISDAGANVGVTDENLIALSSEDADQEGIYMVGVGTGPAPYYNDLLMDVVTDKGRGAYVYLDGPAEATKMFVNRFDEVMEVAARGVQIEMTMPWYFQMHKFYGEEYSPNAADVEPQHLAPSDAMIFNQVIKACDPAVVDGADTIQIKATWQTPLTYQPQEVSVTVSVDALLAGGTAHLHKGKAIVAYAEALKVGTHDAMHAALDVVIAANPGQTDAELNEIASLIPKHPAF